MFRKTLFLTCTALTTLAANEHTSRISVRHIEANGIGYSTGYSTLEGFFAQPLSQWMPFLDARFHVFNNGKLAANVGAGVRAWQPSSPWIWGGAAYYDYRRAHTGFNQLSLGLEALHPRWEFRTNGYIPISCRKSSLFDLAFNRFSGNQILIQQKQDVALYGIDAEAGVHVFSCENDWDLFAGIGPYAYGGKSSDPFAGGKLRVRTEWKEYVALEGSVSYDNVFHDIFQAQLTFNIPFGKPKAPSTSCRLTQPFFRDEIIVVERRKKTSPAIDPATGQPYQVWFVNNLSHSQGTFESPFSTLADAQQASRPSDLIYVYPGDGTTQGMSLGIQLQDNQQLLGAATAQALSTSAGAITIPPQATVMPTIENTAAGSNVVTFGNNNIISGFTLFAQHHSAIAQGNSSCLGLRVTNNVIVNPAAFSAILGTQIGGNVLIANNQISGFFGILLQQTSTSLNANYTCTNNTILLTNGINPVLFFQRQPTDSLQTTATFTLQNNTLQCPSGLGIEIDWSSGSAKMHDAVVITGNDISTVSRGVFLNTNPTVVNSDTVIAATVSGNTVQNTDVGGIVFVANNEAQMSAQITNNQFIGNKGVSGAVLVQTSLNGFLCLQFQGNTGRTSVDTFALQQIDPSAFNLSESNNTPTPVLIGTITPVTSCN